MQPSTHAPNPRNRRNMVAECGCSTRCGTDEGRREDVTSDEDALFYVSFTDDEKKLFSNIKDMHQPLIG